MPAYGTGGYGLGPYGIGYDGSGVPGFTHLFRTPTRPNPRVTVDATPAQRGLYRHFVTAPVGVAVIHSGGQWYESTLPTSNELDAADSYYMGGRDYYVTQAEADALTDAGYGDYLIPLNDDPVGYGLGAYGTGTYGA